MDAPWIREAERFGSRAKENEVIEVCECCNLPFNMNSSDACVDGKNNKFCCHDCFDDFYGYKGVN